MFLLCRLAENMTEYDEFKDSFIDFSLKRILTDTWTLSQISTCVQQIKEEKKVGRRIDFIVRITGNRCDLGLGS